ncbi:MAG: hypothetical protein KBA81_06510 [Rhabdochlamydiaceae bacterium]|nr:hypothetical protein [Rhabdochlamydiaceae bacterium]
MKTKKGFPMSLELKFSPVKTPENIPSTPQKNEKTQEGQGLQEIVEKVSYVRTQIREDLFADIDEDIHPHPTSEDSGKRQRITEFAIPLAIPKPFFLPKPVFGKLERDVTPLIAPKIPTPTLSGERRSDFKWVTPPTPKKATPLNRKSDFEKLHDLLRTGGFRYQGKPVKETIGKGTYCTVYGFGDDSNLVLKAFHGKKTGFNKNVLMECIKTAAQNYDDVRNKLGLPVAVIHNIETISTDLFVIQERMSVDIDPLNPDQMKQINQFFVKSIENDIVIDLQPGNLKLKDGIVVLIDFIEDPDHTVESMIPFICKAWYGHFRKSGLSKEQALDLLTQLTDGASNTYPYVNREWLEKIIR